MVQTLEERFNAKYEVSESGCWNWIAGIFGTGYGQFRVGDKRIGAHRQSYKIFKGEIPEGLVIDHLCRNIMCVNPSHLEAVTSSVNRLRGFNPEHRRVKPHCKNGHDYTPENTKLYAHRKGRTCLICKNIYAQRHSERNRSLAVGE